MNLYVASFEGDILLIYGIDATETGWSEVLRLKRPALSVDWVLKFPAFNVSEGAIEGKFLYEAGIGFISKIDLQSGRFRWCHDDLYGRAGYGFNSFMRPELGPKDVLFRDIPSKAGDPELLVRVRKNDGVVEQGLNPLVQRADLGSSGVCGGASVASVTVSISPSSTHAPGAGYTFDVANLIDGRVDTSWQPRPEDKAPTLTLTFPRALRLRAALIANGFQTSDRLGDEFLLNARIATGRIRFSDGTEVPIRFDTEQRGTQRFEFPAHSTTSITIIVDGTYRGTRWQDLAISEVGIELDADASPSAIVDTVAATVAPKGPTATPRPTPRMRRITCHDWFNMSAADQAAIAVATLDQVRSDYQRKHNKTVDALRAGDYVAFGDMFTTLCKGGGTEDMYTAGMLGAEVAFAQ